jgi:hypothetical protein
MRVAELVTAVVLAVLSLYLMWKSAELPVGWIPDEGPGGGAFPFWLAAGMFACCVAIAVRWVLRKSPPSQSDQPFMDGIARKQFFIVAGSLTAMIALVHVIGVYGSVPLFLVFYMRFLGGHRWVTTGAVAISTPIVTFMFFEIALNITLPKGFSEPLFYPLYDILL